MANRSFSGLLSCWPNDVPADSSSHAVRATATSARRAYHAPDRVRFQYLKPVNPAPCFDATASGTGKRQLGAAAVVARVELPAAVHVAVHLRRMLVARLRPR